MYVAAGDAALGGAVSQGSPSHPGHPIPKLQPSIASLSLGDEVLLPTAPPLQTKTSSNKGFPRNTHPSAAFAPSCRYRQVNGHSDQGGHCCLPVQLLANPIVSRFSICFGTQFLLKLTLSKISSLSSPCFSVLPNFLFKQEIF